MKITYTKQSDYLLPDLCLKERRRIKFGRYANLRLKYIKEEMDAFYQTVLMTDELVDYLLKIDAEATEMKFKLKDTMKRELNINEELKSKDQMKWVQRMNNIYIFMFQPALNCYSRKIQILENPIPL